MTKKISNWFVYIIQTTCGKLYTGITTDIERRYLEHCGAHQGTDTKGAKFFRGHEPQRVIYTEECLDRSSASAREYQIKSLSAHKKRSLIEQNTGLKKGFKKI